jgi:hypothetical protein
MLYNGVLRGFGNCGEVPASEDVEYGSPEFWQLLGAKSVADRMENAGHKFSSTMHALASGVKKIQGIAEDGQGTRLYRGLGKLPIQLFITLLHCTHLLSSLISNGKCFSSSFSHLYYCDSSGGLDVRPFTASSGFTETAFMSSTRELSVALDYSGVKQGKVGTVLPSPPSPLSLFAAFSHRSSTKACHCTS